MNKLAQIQIRTQSGFTIPELIVTIVVMGVMLSISIFAYENIQRDSRDSSRNGTAVIVSEALEKYYTSNGEYPSMRDILNIYPANTRDQVASLLDINSADLTMPRIPVPNGNPISDGPPPHDNYLQYTGMVTSGPAARCTADVGGGCDHFQLSYVSESSGTITIQSRN